MKLSEICIERPVFASVLSLVLVVFGYIGYHQMETRYFPEVETPYAQVSVTLPGASPSLMQNQVTQYLENALINVDGITSLHSTSGYNTSTIAITFADGSNLIKEMGDVRNAVASVTGQLPPDAQPAVISSGGVERPVLNIGFMDPVMTSAQIRDYVTKVIVPQLQKLPGMGAAWVYGASDYALRIWIKPQQMAAFGITTTDIKNALEANNVDFSGGSIQGADRDHPIVANTELHNANQFADLVVRDTNGEMVHLRDVADVELGSDSLQESPMRINGVNAIDLELRPINTANPITVANEAKKALAQLQSHLPPEMTMTLTYDQSQFLKGAIHESFQTLIEAILLVMLVVFLFLGSLRAAIIPVATIPVCVIGAFGLMLIFGFSINVMTLLAVILAIGLVVDDAIVVLENTHRHIEAGLKPLAAAIKGSREIGFSVIAMTLTLAAVYAPTGFTHGFTASVFREFAFTLAGAVLISGFVALTLSPMMCSRVLKPRENLTAFEQWLDHYFDGVNHYYGNFLTQILNERRRVIIGLLGIGLLGYLLYFFLPQEFIPKEDIGYFEVNIETPTNSTINYTDGFMRELEALYAKEPAILSYASFIFAGNATNFVTMKPWDERNESTAQVLEKLRPAMDRIPIPVDVSVPNPIDYGEDTDSSPILIHLTTLGNYIDLNQTVNKLLTVLSGYPGLQNVTTNLRFDNQVYELDFNRQQAAALGVSLQDIADTVSTMLGGKHTTDVAQDSETYQVLVQMNLTDLQSFAGLNNIYVRSASGDMVPLSNLVTLTPNVRQSNLYRYNRMNSADITAEIAPHYDLGKVTKYLDATLDKNLPHSDHYAYGGLIQAFEASSGIMFGLFMLSLIFIYLVLAAQFESFIDPFIILLTVPLCIVGALFALKLTGGSLNLYTNIGLITLVGLISKHGILITQFANVRLASGSDLTTAIREAAITRLRPILMTTFAMALGALPLAFDRGPGSVSHQQIGWVIFGGMMFGTFFSLVVVPIAYYLLAPLDHKKKKLLRGMHLQPVA